MVERSLVARDLGWGELGDPPGVFRAVRQFYQKPQSEKVNPNAKDGLQLIIMY